MLKVNRSLNSSHCINFIMLHSRIIQIFRFNFALNIYVFDNKIGQCSKYPARLFVTKRWRVHHITEQLLQTKLGSECMAHLRSQNFYFHREYLRKYIVPALSHNNFKLRFSHRMRMFHSKSMQCDAMHNVSLPEFDLWGQWRGENRIIAFNYTKILSMIALIMCKYT